MATNITPAMLSPKPMKINRALLSAKQRYTFDRKSGNHSAWLYKISRERSEDRQRWSEPDANFFVGQQKIYLPDFIVSLMRTPRLPATQAQFRVPLHFTKLDIRDYLFHAYNVRITGVRVEIHGPKIDPTQKNPDPRALQQLMDARGERRTKPLSRRLRTEAAMMDYKEADEWDEAEVKKMMIVDLETPFIWPPMLTEERLDEIAGQGIAQLRQQEKRKAKMTDDMRRSGGRDTEGPKQTAALLAVQARALVQGRAVWGEAKGAEEWEKEVDKKEKEKKRKARRRKGAGEGTAIVKAV